MPHLAYALFTADGDAEPIAAAIERGVQEELGLSVAVIVRTAEHLRGVVEHNPLRRRLLLPLEFADDPTPHPLLALVPERVRADRPPSVVTMLRRRSRDTGERSPPRAINGCMSTDLPHTSGAPTLEDVARVAGVSRATVSRVINGIRNVAPDIQEAVHRAIATTGYVPNRAARSLVTRRTGAVALVVSGAGDAKGGEPFESRVFADPFFGRVASGVVGYLRPRGIHPVLMLADSAQTRDDVVSFLRQGSADGALVVSTHGEDPLPKLLVDAGLPAVLWARPARPIPISYVDLAHRAGAALAADRLVARGCRRVATISGPFDVPAAQDRLSGFQEAMAGHGHPYVPAVEGDFMPASGEAGMHRLVKEHPDIDGVFVANDLMAQGALLALRDLGRRVPEDVAVIGFDDSAAVTCRPPLTTVRQPMEDMAAEMARLLLAHAADPDFQVTSIIMQPTLVVRESA